MAARGYATMLLLALALAGCGQAIRWEPQQPRDSVPRPAQAATAPTPVPADRYIVQRGDTLYSIAWRHSLDWRDVARWNALGSADLIFPGQQLRLTPPPSGPTPRVATPAPPPPVPAPPRPASGSSSQAGTAPAPAPSTAPRPIPPPAPTVAAATPQWQWPVIGQVVYRFGDAGALGNGLGVGGRVGQPVLAAAPGSVVYTGRGLIGYGELVILKHNDTFLSAYGHTQEVQVVQGQEVRAGEQIATMGEGPGQRALLHFEVRINGRAVDPLSVLPRVAP